MDDRKCRGPARKTPLPTVVLLISVAMATGQILKNEPKCLAVGGICTVPESCPDENRVVSKSGEKFCANINEDAICCNRVPDNVDNCREHGGRCGGEDDCRNVPNFGQLDCEVGTKCCLLIY